MSCKTPLIRAEEIGNWQTAKNGHRYLKPHIFKTEELEIYDIDSAYSIFNERYKNFTLIPCGKCIECRLAESRDKANRGYKHQEIKTDNYFVTLTYDEYHLPQPEQIITPLRIEPIQVGQKWERHEEGGLTFTKQGSPVEWKGCLYRPDVEKFLHDLRREFAKLGHTGIDYILAGEYGSLNKRPHYHLILFNCPFPLDSFYEPRIINGEMYYQNHLLEKCWKKGISNISEVTWNNIAYVARYITKKINGPGSFEDYAMRGQIKEFSSMSNRPGIGREYYELHKEEIYDQDRIMIKNNKGVHYIQPPRYFDRLLKNENPELMEEIKKKRRQNAHNAQKFKDTLTSLTRYEQMQIELATQEITAMTLKREL